MWIKYQVKYDAWRFHGKEDRYMSGSLKSRIDVLIEVYTQCYSNQRKEYSILTEDVASG